MSYYDDFIAKELAAFGIEYEAKAKTPAPAAQQLPEESKSKRNVRTYDEISDDSDSSAVEMAEDDEEEKKKQDENYVHEIRENFEKAIALKGQAAKRARIDNPEQGSKEVDYSMMPFSFVSEEFSEENCENLLRNYDYSHRYDQTLPIISFKETILKSISENVVSIVQGNTGCGKTTQIPQMILDDHAKKDKYCNIIVTQPRRIAAISNSQRVCSERKWNWTKGVYCGYQIGLDASHRSQFTRILYVTTGILLKKLVSQENDCSRYTHIIIDEVHEREIDTDFVLLILKILFLQGIKSKIVLMSATCNSKLFTDYFSKQLATVKISPKVVTCNYSVFDVKEYYLDDIADMFNTDCAAIQNEPKLHTSLLDTIKKLLMHFDDLEKPNGFDPVNKVPLHRGSVLIFVSGMEDIKMIDKFLKEEFMWDKNMLVIPLHSEIQIEQQVRAFVTPRMLHRKVIISTSIAESSVTLPDIKYVIDFCLTKCLYCDKKTNYEYLRTEWASKANLTQRKGRAGRVSDGICYRLQTKEFCDKLSEYQMPEMMRSSLDKLILNIKQYDSCFNGEPKEVLSMAIQPPDLSSIELTIIRLKMAGALSLRKNGVINPHDGDLTFCGRVMGKLPIDVNYAKLILFGHAFGKLRDCIIIACALSVARSIFFEIFGSTLECYKAKFYFSRGLSCDFTAILNAYKVWRTKEERGAFRSQAERKEWAYSKNLSLQSLYDVYKKMNDVERILKDEFKIVYTDDENDHLNEEDFANFSRERECKSIFLLKILIAAAFYPNYYSVQPADGALISKRLEDYDARTTIALRGFPMDYSMLYHHAIKTLFTPCAKSQNITINYRLSSAFVSFKNSEFGFETNVSFGVYTACLMRMKKLIREFNYMAPRTIQAYKDCLYEITKNGTVLTNPDEQIELETRSRRNDRSDRGERDEIYPIEIIKVVQCGQFKAQILRSENLKIIQECLNKPDQKLIEVSPSDVFVKKMVAAVYLDFSNDTSHLYRAQITKIVDARSVEIVFVDYGNTEVVDMNSLFELSKDVEDMPHHFIKCELINIKPREGRTRWSPESNEYFSKLCRDGQSFEIEIYSDVAGVKRVILLEKKRESGGNFYFVNINDALIQARKADRCSESDESKRNHEKRKPRSTARNDDYRFPRLTDVLSNVELQSYGFLPSGPECPLETKLVPMINVFKESGTRCRIASLNQVLLDDEPGIDMHRLLVAADINFNPENYRNMSSLNYTTLLPKVNGLVPIVSMLFAPCMELRVDRKREKYTGALCGLGHDVTRKKPVYSKFDIEIEFDTRIVENDIHMISSVREGINLVLENEENASMWQNDLSQLQKLQAHNRVVLYRLFDVPRPISKLESFHKPYKWNQVPENQFIAAAQISDNHILYQPHRAIHLKEN